MGGGKQLSKFFVCLLIISRTKEIMCVVVNNSMFVQRREEKNRIIVDINTHTASAHTTHAKKYYEHVSVVRKKKTKSECVSAHTHTLTLRR